jgi:hypothetical protein
VKGVEGVGQTGILGCGRLRLVPGVVVALVMAAVVAAVQVVRVAVLVAGCSRMNLILKWA